MEAPKSPTSTPPPSPLLFLDESSHSAYLVSRERFLSPSRIDPHATPPDPRGRTGWVRVRDGAGPVPRRAGNAARDAEPSRRVLPFPARRSEGSAPRVAGPDHRPHHPGRGREARARIDRDRTP